MARFKPTDADREALLRATEELLNAAGFACDLLRTATLPRRSGVQAVAKTLAAHLEDPHDAGAACVEDVVGLFGSKRATIEKAFAFLSQLTVLRAAFVPERHQRGRYFAVPQPTTWSREQRERIDLALGTLLDTRIARRSPDLRRLLEQARGTVRGETGPHELDGEATILSRSYFRWLEREAPKWINDSRPWSPRSWEDPCGRKFETRDGHCIMPRGHDCGHHNALQNTHHVLIGDEEIALATFLERIHVHTLADAEAFLHAHSGGRHLSIARRAGHDTKQVRAVRQLVELAVLQRILPEGPVSALMTRNLARLGIAAG